MNLCMKPVEDECIYKVTRNEDVTWYKLLTFTNYAQPHYSNAREKENRKFIMAGNRSYAFCLFLAGSHPE